MNASAIETYLRDDIKRSIRNDILPLVSSSKVPEDGGFFAAIREIFAYIDYLGLLFKGKSSSSNAVEFVREYLGQVNSRYRDIGGLLYYAYRHGTIHEYEPKLIELNDGTKLAWCLIKGDAKQIHLTPRRDQGILTIRVHLTALYDDLNDAIDLFIQDLRVDPNLRQNFVNARAKIERGETENQVRQRGKSYLLQSDFNSI